MNRRLKSGLRFLTAPVRETPAYKRVRRSLARRRTLKRPIESALELISAIESVKPVNSAAIFEVGPGRRLNVAMLSWVKGAERIVMADPFENPDPRRILAQWEWFRANKKWLSAALARTRGGGDRLRLERLLELDARTPEILTRRVLELCEIEFLAGTDAGRLGGEYDGGFDIHLSHYALEHVPPDDIHGVLETAARLLKPGGVSAHKIDHTDHVAHDDPSLDLMDFLRFDDSEWANRTAENGFAYVNRLRASAYPPIFAASGLEIRVKTNSVDEASVRSIESGGLPLAERFRGADARDLASDTSIIVAERPEERRERAAICET